MSRLVAAEVLKVRSVRSYRLTIIFGALMVVAAAGAMAAVTARGEMAWDPQPVALPLEYFAYVMMIIGVLMVTSEISSGTAAVTYSLVPWRSRLMLGKYLAVGVIALPASILVSVLVVAADWVGSGAGAGTVFTTQTLAVTMSGLVAVLVAALLGVAVGSVIRFSAAAVSILLVWSFLIETIVIFLIPERFGAFLPFKTIGGSRLLMGELGAGAGLAIFAVYAALLIALAAFLHGRRDAPTA